MAAIYKRAPIAEAVIDLHVAFETAPTIESLELFADLIRSEFPQKQRINSLAMAVNGTEDGALSSNASAEQIGWRLTNQVGDRVLQVRRNGISYSHMAPYTEWEVFCGDMLPIWDRFRTAVAPHQVTRLAVRYINRIVIPQGADLDIYLNLSPRLLPNVGSMVEGYFMQLVLPQTDLGPSWKAIVNTGLESPVNEESMSVLLDIDLFCETPISPENAHVLEVLTKLRERKNQIFEAAITDEVRRMIQ
jgi:uncharacterized protein (TIGR04255 family)